MKPFLKWAGGKQRILPLLKPLLPGDLAERTYCEPMMGGGAMFFSLPREATARLSDTNYDLMYTYSEVQSSPESVIVELQTLANNHSKDTFYQVREKLNSGSLYGACKAAAFIYLNRTCFNGLYRVNKDNKFNVPMGKYKNPKILDASLIRQASVKLKKAVLHNSSIQDFAEYVNKNCFVYLDPPYDDTYQGYTSASLDQECVRDTFVVMDEKGAKVMMSSSDTPKIRSLYQGYRIDTLVAPRSISRNGRGRKPVQEIVIRNY